VLNPDLAGGRLRYRHRWTPRLAGFAEGYLGRGVGGMTYGANAGIEYRW
jgi:hypothetical protein